MINIVIERNEHKDFEGVIAASLNLWELENVQCVGSLSFSS